MFDAISHRGPDDHGAHVTEKLGLGTNRLQIVGTVILPLYQQFGAGFVARLAGMFSIAIHDEDADRIDTVLGPWSKTKHEKNESLTIQIVQRPRHYESSNSPGSVGIREHTHHS